MSDFVVPLLVALIASVIVLVAWLAMTVSAWFLVLLLLVCIAASEALQ